jgi:hypothetical protein
VSDRIPQWASAKQTPERPESKRPASERFMQRQVTKRVKHNEWDTISLPARWQKRFDDGDISATEYARILASLAVAPNITNADKADIVARQQP